MIQTELFHSKFKDKFLISPEKLISFFTQEAVFNDFQILSNILPTSLFSKIIIKIYKVADRKQLNLKNNFF